METALAIMSVAVQKTANNFFERDVCIIIIISKKMPKLSLIP